jgi:hypothetical protein
VVLVTKLDRLGRSTRELLDLIERVGNAINLLDPITSYQPLNSRSVGGVISRLVDQQLLDGQKPRPGG